MNFSSRLIKSTNSAGHSGSSGSGMSEANTTARHAASGLRAHQMSSVEICPCRIDFSRADSKVDVAQNLGRSDANADPIQLDEGHVSHGWEVYGGQRCCRTWKPVATFATSKIGIPLGVLWFNQRDQLRNGDHNTWQPST